MPNNIKVAAEQWLNAARQALVTEGVSGIKVDRLATQLGVTRGGFYHHYKSRRDLLNSLLNHWAKRDVFFPMMEKPTNPASALAALKATMSHLISEKAYSPALETAMRDWARVDDAAKGIVERVDKKRIKRLQEIFEALGCDKSEARIRARVLYFHQIGYYSLGLHQKESKAERMRNSSIYLHILCGSKFLEAAEGAQPNS
ncbi:MAG: TetR/AcrR family transcriptional regulator [Pseudomonadota bacterium]